MGYRDCACSALLGCFSAKCTSVRIVLAAALWQHPHILILDELADYLDFEDSLDSANTSYALWSCLLCFGSPVFLPVVLELVPRLEGRIIRSF